MIHSETDKASGNNDEACKKCNCCVDDADENRLAEDASFLVKIASEDSHRTDTKAQREECLIHRADDNVSVYLCEVGHKVEGKTFLSTVKGE